MAAVEPLVAGFHAKIAAMGSSGGDVRDDGSAARSTVVEDTPEGTRARERADARPEIHPGDRLGRYTIRSLIGAGGMGRVFAAFDPELNRTVALKVILPDRSSGSGRAPARLLREAQTLARLHHPNVVTVHDVGTQDDQIFIAMELVEGTTLWEWARDDRRGWREVLAAFVAAGRGLAAAHAVGIVHRDFKPLNVIVGGDRVVVVDFGLARAGADEAPEPRAPDGARVPAADLTLTGELVGTPRYMAPEQRAGGVVTEAADQYAFCVSLWEGLHGAPPGGPPREHIPGWLNAAVTRGLSPDPADRWRSVDELLAALARDPAAARRRIVLGAAAAVVAIASVWGVARWRAVDPCIGASARLAGVWDAPRKDAVHAAFAATKLPYGDDAWRGASARIDDYTARWVDMSREACRATRVEGRQSDTLMDMRMACLDRRRAALGALTDLWASGMDRNSLQTAMQAARGLPSLAECADARALTERVPASSDPVVAAKVAAARAHLDKVHALALARSPAAKVEAAAARAEAEASGSAQVRAEVALAEGDILANAQDPNAQAALVVAVRLAGGARDDRLAARALVLLVSSLAEAQQNAERAVLVADLADGALSRLADAGLLRGWLLRNRGQALLTEGKLVEAWATLTLARAYFLAIGGDGDFDTVGTVMQLARVASAHGDFALAKTLGEESLARSIALLGPRHPIVADALTNQGTYVLSAGDLEAAADYFRRALAIQEESLAPGSADIGLSLNNIGAVALELGRLEEAEAALQRALVVRERLYGPDHAFVAQTLDSLATVERKRGRFDHAIEVAERSLAIKTKAYGPGHALVAGTQWTLGTIFEAKGDEAGALDYYRRGWDTNRQARGPDHPNTLGTEIAVVWALAQLRRCGEARPMLATLVPGVEKAFGAEHPFLAVALMADALCNLVDGQGAQAVLRADRALAIVEKAKVAPVDVGGVRWIDARALWAVGRRADAVAAARVAERELAADADGARDRVAARAFLAAHAR